MIEETVSLNFDPKNLDEIEARLSAAGDKLVERVKSGLVGATVGGGGASPGGGSPGGVSGGTGSGGGAPAGGGGAAGAGANLAAAAIHGAGQALGNLSPATVNSPAVAAREAGLGAAKGLVTAGASAAGAAIGTALGGPAGTVVGAAVGNAVGSYAEAQFRALDESIHRPEDATANRLKAYAGTLEAHGIHVSDAFLAQQARAGITIERRRLEGERRAERIVKETGVHMSSLSYGISQLGR